MKYFFQKLVLSMAVAYLIFVFIPYAWGYIYREEILNALAWNGYGGLINPYGVVPYFFAAFFLVSLFGLYKFKSWARSCFVVYVIASAISLPFWGLAVIGNIDGIISYFITVASGFILALSYFSSLNEEFK